MTVSSTSPSVVEDKVWTEATWALLITGNLGYTDQAIDPNRNIKKLRVLSHWYLTRCFRKGVSSQHVISRPRFCKLFVSSNIASAHASREQNKDLARVSPPGYVENVVDSQEKNMMAVDSVLQVPRWWSRDTFSRHEQFQCLRGELQGLLSGPSSLFEIVTQPKRLRKQTKTGVCKT